MTRCMVGEVVSVICDDTDVFALLLQFLAEMKPNGLLYMCSLVKDRAVIDIMQNVNVHTSIVPNLLSIPALTFQPTHQQLHLALERSRWPELLGSRYMLLEIHMISRSSYCTRASYVIHTGLLWQRFKRM